MSVSKIEFLFKIPNVSQLETIETPEYIIHGIPWRVKVKKIEYYSENVEIFLVCTKPKNSTH